MRHHCRTKNTECEIQHVTIGNDLCRRCETADHLAPVRISHCDLNSEACRDNSEHADDKRLDPTEADGLQREDEEDIERRYEDTDLKRNAEQEIEANGRADDLREIGCSNRDFGEQPKRPCERLGESIAARLGKVAPRSDAEPRTQRLQNDGHDVGHQRHRKQRITEFGTARERSRPVAGIHVAGGDEITRPQERSEFAPERAGPDNLDRGKHAGQRRLASRHAPPAGDRDMTSGHSRRGRKGRLCIHACTMHRSSPVASDLQEQFSRPPFGKGDNSRAVYPLTLARLVPHANQKSPAVRFFTPAIVKSLLASK